MTVQRFSEMFSWPGDFDFWLKEKKNGLLTTEYLMEYSELRQCWTCPMIDGAEEVSEDVLRTLEICDVRASGDMVLLWP